MLCQRISTVSQTALLLGLLPVALASAHGDDHGMDMGSMGAMSSHNATTASNTSEPIPLSYFRLGEYSGWIYGHIIVMTLTWTVLLPLAAVFSVAQSKFALPSQLLFFCANAMGLVFGVIYNANTPDLYENNAHHKMGWVYTWFALAWIILGILNLYAKRFGHARRGSGQSMSIANMTRYSRLQHVVQEDRRWSGDSGQGTERNSDSLFGTGSPSTEPDQPDIHETLPLYSANEGEASQDFAEKKTFLQNTKVERFLIENIHRVSYKVLIASQVFYLIFERLLVVLGFTALATGAVTYAGVFHGGAVLGALAHWIKGGIFFWYGLLTLGRWMGSFADFGWAWNVKPGVDLVPSWKTKIPSAEFTESFVIALYGITNVWLEHLSAWGDAWAPQDFEHISITILFLGGGVLGMLIESSRIRELLSTHIINVHEDAVEHSPSTAEEETWKQPNNYHVPLNAMPAIVIFLLGTMMSSHTQESMISSMVHKQWGQLFVGFALARGFTYLMIYIKPYTSYLPSRPPTEIIASFCLTAGGLIFMASARDVVLSIEFNGLDEMFIFTVTMGVTALIMAWTVILLAIKGWAVRKEKPHLFNRRVGISQQA